MVHKIKFYFRLLHDANPLLLDLLWLHFSDSYIKDDYLHNIFNFKHLAISVVQTTYMTSLTVTVSDCSCISVFIVGLSSPSFAFVCVFSVSFLANKGVHNSSMTLETQL